MEEKHRGLRQDGAGEPEQYSCFPGSADRWGLNAGPAMTSAQGLAGSILRGLEGAGGRRGALLGSWKESEIGQRNRNSMF